MKDICGEKEIFTVGLQKRVLKWKHRSYEDYINETII